MIGWWRPVILLPIGALAGLTPAQADAILVHELAHIRRHDYLVNGLQHAAETLLFYHPAVWWLSRRMRIEREHCCDGVVVQVCGDPIDYAVALAELEAGRSRRMALAVAATDGSLVRRIRVLLAAQPSHRRPLADAMVTAFVVAALVIVAGGYRWTVRASVDAAPRAQQATPGPETVVVTVNGEAITDGDLRRRQPLKRDRPDAPLSEVLAAAIDERLVVQRGKQLGYALSDDQFQLILRNLAAQNALASADAVQGVLNSQQLTLADLRKSIESQVIASRLRFDMTAATPVTDAEAREYFASHADAFPLQTFELARPRIEELLADAHRGPRLGTLRSRVTIRRRSRVAAARHAARLRSQPGSGRGARAGQRAATGAWVGGCSRLADLRNRTLRHLVHGPASRPNSHAWSAKPNARIGGSAPISATISPTRLNLVLFAHRRPAQRRRRHRRGTGDAIPDSARAGST